VSRAVFRRGRLRLRGGRGDLRQLGLGYLLLFRLGLRGFVPVKPAQLHRHIFVDGAGVRFLFGNPQFGEPFENFVSLDFQLPRQLVNSNLLHR
jgi:hypothetical protein